MPVKHGPQISRLRDNGDALAAFTAHKKEIDTTLQQTACKLGQPFLYIGAEVLIAWILFDRPA